MRYDGIIKWGRKGEETRFAKNRAFIAFRLIFKMGHCIYISKIIFIIYKNFKQEEALPIYVIVVLWPWHMLALVYGLRHTALQQQSQAVPGKPKSTWINQLNKIWGVLPFSFFLFWFFFWYVQNVKRIKQIWVNKLKA